ncbi:hypothetical protein OV079_51095 [Nannocystis pusilla]|uniref:Uncharacterized protein n=1 Tax=Nannocystis pusilla TaxID=889268 RepID=A0A9X3J536_9BACT|nr:hypothetical protein [Nannocystis pusilla]MCY1013738.1 hypothetical protein [Nannocystis pusilla]
MRRHPVLDGLISEDTLLEFRSYRDVQHLTDTFVSERRYGMVGDAASIIDAYYSQGISLAMVTSWHIANIVERDVREHRLDRAYIDRVNDATVQDWQIMRNMVREKYSPAIADSRFFALSHLDFVVLFASGPVRADLVRWLIDTEGDTSRETPSPGDPDRLEQCLYSRRPRPGAGCPPSACRRSSGPFKPPSPSGRGSGSSTGSADPPSRPSSASRSPCRPSGACRC